MIGKEEDGKREGERETKRVGGMMGGTEGERGGERGRERRQALTCVTASSGEQLDTPNITERSRIFTGNSSRACRRAGPKYEL